MKAERFFIAVLVALMISTVTFGQKQDSPSTERYVIIGVFRVLDNAIRFTDEANKKNFSAGYAQNSKNKLYYVYILQTNEPKKAQAFMMKVRLETDFKEAWVYKGSLGVPLSETPVTKAPETKEPVTEPIKDPSKDPSKDPTKEPVVTQPTDLPKDSTAITTEKPVVTTPNTDSTKTVTTMTPKPTGKPFFFKLVSSETNQPVVGEVHIFEPNGASQTYQAFPANQVVYLNAPKDPSQVYAVSTLSAGFQEMHRSINYADPANSSTEVGSVSEFVIALPVVHVKMGDYIEFKDVRFYQNSVMLHPESQEELDGLAELLKENPRYKVNVHAHCNGTQDRNIIMREKDSKEFFGDKHSGKTRKSVSDKQLTELRAELVKDYLVSQGVASKRILTKGEGGAALIYPVNSTLSNRNDRVEIEVKRGK